MENINYRNTNLKSIKLDFSHNKINNLEGIDEKLYYFENLNTIELNLSHNQIANDGCDTIINALLKLKNI